MATWLRVELRHVLDRLHLGENDRIERGTHDAFQVVEGLTSDQSVDPDRAHRVDSSGGIGLKRLKARANESTCLRLLVVGHSVFEVEDDLVDAGGDGLRDPVRLVSGDEQRRSNRL